MMTTSALPPPLEEDDDLTVESIPAADPARIDAEKAVNDLDRMLAEYICTPGRAGVSRRRDSSGRRRR